MQATPVRITHVITDLNAGGAEITLYRLLSSSNRGVFRHEVVSMLGDGPIGVRIRTLGIPVYPVQVRGLASIPKMLYSVAAQVRQTRPDIVHTWMYHSDLAGGIAAKLFTSAKIIWHIHHKDLTPPLMRLRTRYVARACARLSRSIPDTIICCSKAAMKTHADFGYDAERMTVIPNGFDLNEFRPDAAQRTRVRAELGIAESSFSVAMIGRFSPMKDHETFLAASGLIRQRHPQTTFVLCGDGVTADNEALRLWVERAGLAGNCCLLGKQENIPEIMSAADLVVSSSRTEAFPCVIGEAMAMEVPCVVTDVGDASLIVGETGKVVPRRNPQALADACSEMIRMSRNELRILGLQARERVRREFSLPLVVERVETLYRQLSARELADSLSDRKIVRDRP
jgi:glycosyltransferase involved in cell wall biosynthesis